MICTLVSTPSTAENCWGKNLDWMSLVLELVCFRHFRTSSIESIPDEGCSTFILIFASSISDPSLLLSLALNILFISLLCLFNSSLCFFNPSTSRAAVTVIESLSVCQQLKRAQKLTLYIVLCLQFSSQALVVDRVSSIKCTILMWIMSCMISCYVNGLN